MKNWHSITLCVLISGTFLSFLLETLFVQTLFLWMLGAFAIYTFICTRKIYFQWYSVFFAAIFLLRAWALWRQPELKFSDIELSLSFVLFPLIFTFVKVEKKQWKIIQKSVVCGFSVFLCTILLRYIVNVCVEGMFLDSLKFAKGYYGQFLKTPFYDHPSFLAVILASGIPMCFNLAANARKHWQKWLWLIYVPVLFFFVFIIGSRVGLIICAVLILTCFIWFFKKLGMVANICIGLSIAAAALVFRVSNINYTKDSIRNEMNSFAIEKIKKRPLWGHGYDTQKQYLEEQHKREPFQIAFIATLDHFHNMYVDEPFQFGLVGALPFYLLLLYLIYLCIRKRDVFLLSFLLIYLLFFYTELPVNSAKGVMPMMLLIGLVMCTQDERTQKKLQS